MSERRSGSGVTGAGDQGLCTFDHGDPAVAVLELRPGVTVEMLDDEPAPEPVITAQRVALKRDALIARLRRRRDEERATISALPEGSEWRVVIAAREAAFDTALADVVALLGGGS